MVGRLPDRNGLSLWTERDAEFHLRKALEAFERSIGSDLSYHKQTEVWLQELKRNKVVTVEELASKCHEELSHNLDQDGVQQEVTKKQKLDASTLSIWQDPTTSQRLIEFLPSPLGFQCLRLAEQAVERVEAGTAKTTYGHRGSKQGEKWIINDNDDNWTLNVDCAGFVRNVIESITGSALLVSLSDRDYMRAKDFYTFFERLEYSVETNNNNNVDRIPRPTSSKLQWCRVDDLRTILAGDIIVYRAAGGAAGGSVFTKKDCLEKALTTVKTAELYDIMDEETEDQHQPVTINVARLPEVKEWVKDVMEILRGVGIESTDQLRGNNNGANDEDNDDNLQATITMLLEHQEEKFSDDTVSLLQEVLSSQNGNTGHVMFVAGPAEETRGARHVWQVPVYHSTGVAPKRKRGFQRAYKRFEYKTKLHTWKAILKWL